MILILSIISWIGLALTLVPSLLFFADQISLETLKTAMTLGMGLWLVSAPFVQKAKAKLVEESL